LDSQSIGYWGRWGRGGGRVIYLFISKKHWDCLGGLIAEISLNGDLNINPLTFSQGFFMKIFNNFGRKIEEKGKVPHI
jgi:hypothetical protein